MTGLIPTGVIHCGDCLSVLRDFPDACIDLIAIDPPFNTGRDFKATSGSTRPDAGFSDRFGSNAAYIGYMRPRCEAFRRVLKPSGSLYYHCDPHANAYVRMMLDEVFGIENFRGAIAWKRTSAHSSAARRCGAVHDTIFYYSMGDHPTWNPPAESVGDLWDDIPPLNATSRQRTGYPTQKPVALLERIIGASSNPGDVVMDAFCGSGTALVAAQNLGRRWIGIDASPAAVAVAESRLAEAERRHGPEMGDLPLFAGTVTR